MNPGATHHSRPRANPSLGWFVSLSLILHLVVLWALLPNIPNRLAVSDQIRVSTLAVRLQPHPTAPSPRPVNKTVRPVPVAAKTSVQKKPPTPSATKAISQAIQPPPVVASHPALETEQAETSPATQSGAFSTYREDTDDDAALQKQLTISIQQALADNFSYPLMARRRGWQGEVLLAFRIETDGRILDARIARSSGYGLLDKAALTALGKVKRLEHGMPRSFTMQLPVIYRLEG